MKTRFKGVFLTSEAPETTYRFYRDVAGLDLEEVRHGEYSYWKSDLDGVQLAIHDAAKFSDYSFPAIAASNLTHLYFKIERQEDFLAHLATLAISPIATDEVVITVRDPDGRYVMFGTA